MSQTRREVRKLDVQRTTTFDEKLWPIQIVWAILVLYCAGIAVRTFSFSEIRPWRNASVWLFLLAICYVLGVSTWRTCGKRFIQRSSLLSLLLSLIVNLSVLVTLAGFDLFVLPKLANTVDPKKETPKFVEYKLDSEAGEDRPRRDFERPVEAGSPESPQEQTAIQKVATAMSVNAEAAAEVPAETDVVDSRRLSKILRAVIETVPHLADLQGTISRQSIQVRPTESKPSLVAESQPQQQNGIQLQAAPSNIQRTTTQLAASKVDTEFEPAIELPNDSTGVARRADEIAPAEIASAEPTLRRKVRSPFSLPNAALPEAEQGGMSLRTAESSLEAATTADLAKEDTASPRRSVLEEPQIDDLVQIQPAKVERSQPLPEAAQVANLPEPNSRRAELVEVSATNSEARTDAAQANPANDKVDDESIRPATEAIARTATDAPMADPNLEAVSEPVERTMHPNRTTDMARAVKDVEAPELAREMEANPIDRSEPTTTADPTSSLAATLDLPATTINGSPDSEPSTETAVSPTAISKSVHGIAGSREEPNFENESPAKPSLLNTASASAKRDVAMQEEAGPALAPSDAPAVKRARSESQTPSASMAAREVAGATAATDNSPREIDAGSSSTIERAGSNVLAGPVSASKGDSDVDFGPTRYAGGSGQKRASGGGQPEVNFDPTNGAFPRRTAPSQASPASTSAIVDPGGIASADQSTPADEPVSPSESSPGRTPNPPSRDPVELAGPEVAAAHEPTSGGTSLAENSAVRPLRAQSVEAMEAPLAKLGGGNSLPTRAAQGRTIDLDRRARTLNLPGTDASSGIDDALPIAADNQLDGPIASGLPQRTQAELTGALDEDRVFDGHSAGPSLTTTRSRTASRATEEGSTIADDSGAGLNLRRETSIRLPAAALSTKVLQVPPAGTDSQTNPDSIPDRVATAIEIGSRNRNSSGGLEVPVDALEGVGGLMVDPSDRIGLRRRTASSEATSVVDLPSRFIRNQFGSPPATNSKAVIPTKAFENRLNRRGVDAAGGKNRPTPKTEEAIELGLVFLSRQQFSDGSWSLNFTGDGRLYDESERATIRSDTAATGMALLSYLGAGYQHRSEKYQLIVRNGLEYLIDQQKEDGDLYVPEDEESNRSAWLYSHAIAAIALCEAYGMTQDPWLKEAGQKSLDFIVKSQNPERGGWRYAPGVSSDTSVTGWMMMALRSGQLSGLTVPAASFEKIVAWLEEAQADHTQPHLYRYNPFAHESQRSGRIPSPTMTSVGLLMRLYSGRDRDRPEMIDGANYLLKNLPVNAFYPQRDTYYWYYATQVMFHMSGDYWRTWNARLHPLLVESQIKSGPMAGSWNPVYPVPDRWGPHAGRLYVTTLNLLSLEVYYRHLPIYVDTAK